MYRNRTLSVWLLACVVVMSAVSIGGPPLLAAERLEGHVVMLKIPMPASDEGIDIWPNKNPPRNYREEEQGLRRYGVAVKEGGYIKITEIKNKGKEVEVLLGQGGAPHRGSFQNPFETRTICGPPDLRRREQELRRQVQDPRLTPDDVERVKERLARVEEQLRPYNEDCARQYREERLKQGSRFVIHFEAKITSDQLTEEFLKPILREYIDFDPPIKGDDEVVVSVPWDKLKKGVVKILSEKADDKDVGAGIVIGADADAILILTAYHVVESATKLQVTFFQRQWESYSARRLERFNEDLDLAVIVVDSQGDRKPPKDLLEMAIRGPASLREAEKVYAIGFPPGVDWDVPQNNVVERNVGVDDQRTFWFSKDGMDRGFSGGAVFDRNGALMGIITRMTSRHTIAINIDAALHMLLEWRVPTTQLMRPKR